MHTSSTAPASRSALLAAFATVYLVWGSTYLAIRFGVDSIPPLALGAVRSLVGGALLYGWGRLHGTPGLSAREWRRSAVVGALMFGVGHGALFWAIVRVPSGVASLFIATIPLWMSLAEGLTDGLAAVQRRTMIGLVGGLGGIALLVGPNRLIDGDPVDPVGAVVLLAAAAAWAAGSAIARRSHAASVVVSTGAYLLCGGVLLAGGALISGELGAIDAGTISVRSMLALAYLIVFGSILALGAYYWLLRRTTLVALSTYAYVNPVVALALGWLLAGEALSPRIGIASGLILVSVAAILSSRAPAPATTPTSTR
jgi:drug/metabolite transporter (DMT)-like permease